MKMEIEATIDIETKNSELLKRIMVEEQDRGNVTAEADLLKINISTETISGLRAAVNSYINWLMSSEELIETKELMGTENLIGDR
jgi:tRNA threonylcarbamoyladenosine modification (KEOPS) complex  Pcc1 subunit